MQYSVLRNPIVSDNLCVRLHLTYRPRHCLIGVSLIDPNTVEPHQKIYRPVTYNIMQDF